MQLVKVLILFFTIYELIIANKIKMNLGDKNICLSCLNVIDNLKIVKNSDSCNTGNVNYDMMCYQIYYYFSYFKPHFFFYENLFESKESRCEVCSFFDKCEFYECNDGNNKFNTQFNSKITDQNINKNVSNITTYNEVKQKQKSFEHDVKSLKFVSKEKQNEESNFINDYFSILKIKVQHILDHLLNLSELNTSAQQIRKNLVNLFIFNKLKNENKINFHKNNTIVKIKNKSNMKNFSVDVKKLSEKFIEIFEKYEIKFTQSNDDSLVNTNESNLKYLTSFLMTYNELYSLGHTIYNSNTKLFKNIIDDFTEDKIIPILNKTNPNLNKIVNMKNQSINKNDMNKKLNHTNTFINTNKNLNKINLNLEKHIDKILPTLPLQQLQLPNNEIKILIEKISKLEKEQEKFNSLLFKKDSDMMKLIDSLKEKKNIVEPNIKILNNTIKPILSSFDHIQNIQKLEKNLTIINNKNTTIQNNIKNNSNSKVISEIKINETNKINITKIFNETKKVNQNQNLNKLPVITINKKENIFPSLKPILKPSLPHVDTQKRLHNFSEFPNTSRKINSNLNQIYKMNRRTKNVIKSSKRKNNYKKYHHK